MIKSTYHFQNGTIFLVDLKGDNTEKKIQTECTDFELMKTRREV